MRKICIIISIIVIVGAVAFAVWNGLKPVQKIDTALGKVTYSGPDYIIIQDIRRGPMTLKIDHEKVKVVVDEQYSVKFDANNLQIIDVIGGEP